KLVHPLEHLTVDLLHHLSPVAAPAGVGGVHYERLGQIGGGGQKDMPSPPAPGGLFFRTVVLARQLIDDRIVHSHGQRFAIRFIFSHGCWHPLFLHRSFSLPKLDTTNGARQRTGTRYLPMSIQDRDPRRIKSSTQLPGVAHDNSSATNLMLPAS